MKVVQRWNPTLMYILKLAFINLKSSFTTTLMFKFIFNSLIASEIFYSNIILPQQNMQLYQNKMLPSLPNTEVSTHTFGFKLKKKSIKWLYKTHRSFSEYNRIICPLVPQSPAAQGQKPLKRKESHPRQEMFTLRRMKAPWTSLSRPLHRRRAQALNRTMRRAAAPCVMERTRPATRRSPLLLVVHLTCQQRAMLTIHTAQTLQ